MGTAATSKWRRCSTPASADSPSTGVLIVGNYTQGGVNTPGVARFVYGPDHEKVAAQAKAAWKEWLVQRFAAAD